MLLQLYTCLVVPGKLTVASLASSILKQLIAVTLQREQMWMVVQHSSVSLRNGTPASLKCGSAASGAVPQPTSVLQVCNMLHGV